MKKIFTLLAVVLSIVALHAQTANAVVFSEDGDKFTLILNGEPKNSTPQVNVKVPGLTGSFYTAKIDFENSAILDITSKNFAVEAGKEATYVIKKTKKGEYVLRFHSYTEMGSTAAAPSSDTGISDDVRRIAVVDDGHSDDTMTESISQTVATPAGGVNADVVITETTTTKTTGKPANGESINVGMNVGGVNMGINMNVSGMDIEENSSTTVTTTTTTKTSTSGTTTGAVVKEQPRQQTRQDVVVREEVTPCGVGMSSSSFATAKKSIADKGFDDTRLTIAKQVTTSNCLSVVQIKEIMSVFGFEETRLEYAKFAHGRCTNPGDYYLINDAFSFSSSIDELNEYIQSK